MSRNISFSNDKTKDFGVRADLLSDVTLTDTGFTIDFYVSNGDLHSLSHETGEVSDLTKQAAAYGIEQRIKTSANLKADARTPEKISEIVAKSINALQEHGWQPTRSVGTTPTASILEQAFLAKEGNTKEMWDALDIVGKRVVRKDAVVNKEYLRLQYEAA